MFIGKVFKSIPLFPDFYCDACVDYACKVESYDRCQQFENYLIISYSRQGPLRRALILESGEELPPSLNRRKAEETNQRRAQLQSPAQPQADRQAIYNLPR